MKTRNGFVSNSSSSSFIIPGGDIKDIAESMIDTISEEYEGYRKHKKLWKSNLAKALKKRDVKNEKLGITFPSCNYDTYIIKKEGTVYITTCNNYHWEIEAVDVFDDERNKEIGNIIDKSFYVNLTNMVIHSKDIFEEEQQICPKCKVVRRHGVIMIICANPKHKQRQG